jgi:cell cycle sensor histidine kinase DivJ
MRVCGSSRIDPKRTSKESVELSASATRTEELLKALGACCERLVHPSVTEPTVRGRHARLIGILLASPLLVSAAMAMLFPTAFGVLATLALIGAAFTLSWFAAALLSLSGRKTGIEPAAMTLAVLFFAGIVAASGGPASPVLLTVLALPFEAVWLVRTPRAAKIGTLAGLAVMPLQAMIDAIAPGGGAEASGWHWILPLAYAAFAVPRAAAWAAGAGRQPAWPVSSGLEGVIDAVALRFGPTGEVADASPQARPIIGVAPELLLGDGLFDRIHVADRVRYLCALAELRHGPGRQRVDLRLRSPADRNGPGAYRPFLLEMMRDEDCGETILAVLRSNEEVAGLRESLAAAKETAENVSITRNRTLAAVSHELRTPLNAIIGFSDMLLCEMFGSFRDPRQKEYVGLIGESGRHLLAVVNSMLDITRLESGTYATNPERFRFGDAVDMCVSMLGSAAAARQVDICTEFGPEPGEIKADRHAVQQMLINLVSNAIKFTPEGGHVTIAARRAGPRLVFRVSDTGIGIGADDLALIGEPFVQVHNDYTRRFEGAGLGLSLVKGLVSLHDGTMQIESEPGHGTTVTISLPVDGPAQEEANLTEPIVRLPGETFEEAHDGTFRKTA